ncbi:MAG: ABC transporter permease, partial [Melioribacteraceae bacterium]|nr:ABC transporter permease [Melioribacteraceae bacterium]
MIFKIAWRNIWRQKTRSIVIIASIAVGIWAGIMMTGLATGMIESYVSDSILDIYSHLQIHHPKFGEEFELQYKVSTDDHFRNILDKNVDIANFSERTIVVGMANTSRNARSARLVGIDPSKEVEMTSIHKKLKEGEYLNRDDNNKILVSQRMADKMNVKLRSKIILTFQDANADIVASAYRIKGIYQTNNQLFDENHVFVLKHELDELVYQSESNEVSNEIAIILIDKDELEMVKSDLLEQFPDLKVESYKDLSPDINLYESQIENISIIYLVIIMLAHIFGIINTMLMAVLERVREL